MNEFKKTQLTFTADELKILNAALGEIPYRVAAPLIASINRQIQEEFDRARDDHTPSGVSASSLYAA
jgi:hypothetical protein